MASVKTDEEEVLEAMEMVRTMNLSKMLRARYEAYWKAVRDRDSEDEYVRRQGRKEGLGKKAARAKSVDELFQNKFPIY